MGAHSVMLTRALMSSQFTGFLQQLAGIERKLKSDPTYNSGGLAHVSVGGRLGMLASTPTSTGMKGMTWTGVATLHKVFTLAPWVWSSSDHLRCSVLRALST